MTSLSVPAGESAPAEAKARTEVLFYYFILPHYRLSLFNKVKDLLGCSVSVLYAAREDKGASVTGIDLTDRFQECCELHPRKKMLLPFGFFYIRGTLSAIRGGRYDVVIFQASPWDLSSMAAFVYCRLAGIPFAWWNKGYAAESVRPAWSQKVLYRRLSNMPDLIIPYGSKSVRYFLSLGVPSDRIVEAFNTVDVTELSGRRAELTRAGREFLKDHGVPLNRKVISTVGRLTPKKRSIDLVRAAEILKSRGHAVSTVIGGIGEDFEDLERYIGDHDLDDSVFLLGRLPDDVDNAVLAASDAAVFCGGHGLAINQAMALGTLVFAAEEDGPDSEMVLDGETGFRFPKGDPVMLADALERRILQGDYPTEVIRRAKVEMLEVRNEENYALAFAGAIRRLVERPK